MTDELEKLVARMEKDGVGSVMMGLRHDPAASNIPIQAALAEFERRQGLKRDGELDSQLKKQLDAQEAGNKTQTKILRILVATLVVAILVAIFKD